MQFTVPGIYWPKATYSLGKPTFAVRDTSVSRHNGGLPKTPLYDSVVMVTVVSWGSSICASWCRQRPNLNGAVFCSLKKYIHRMTECSLITPDPNKGNKIWQHIYSLRNINKSKEKKFFNIWQQWHTNNGKWYNKVRDI